MRFKPMSYWLFGTDICRTKACSTTSCTWVFASHAPGARTMTNLWRNSSLPLERCTLGRIFICKSSVSVFVPAIAHKISEDFGLQNAKRILEKYRPHVPCFNDDIQGTGCVTLAALMSAFHVSGTKMEEARIVIFGAGSAGTGIAAQIADAIAMETHKSKAEASKQIW